MTDMTNRTDEHLENTIAYTQRRIADLRNSIKYQTFNHDAAVAELERRQTQLKREEVDNELVNAISNYFSINGPVTEVKFYDGNDWYTAKIVKEA